MDKIYPTELYQIILKYLKTSIKVETKQAVKYVTNLGNINDMKLVKSITIYGNLTLVNPIRMFKNSIIENIILIRSKIKLVGDCTAMFYNAINFNQPLEWGYIKCYRYESYVW